MKHALWPICGVLLLLTAARARAESATQVFERVSSRRGGAEPRCRRQSLSAGQRGGDRTRRSGDQLLCHPGRR